MKKLIVFCFSVLLCILFNNSTAFAENFYIDNYKVKINVTPKNVAKVTEELDIFFTEASHGIYRTIPLQSNISRADGSSYTSRSRIKKINVNRNYKTIYDTRGQINIKIGDADRYVSGFQKYIIEYDMYLGNDKLKKADEFYFNIIGTEWDTDIRHAEFQVVMPKDFNPDKVGLSMGRYGVKGFYRGAEFSINDKIISGQTKRVLLPNEGITIRITLPDNYFIPDLLSEEINKISIIILLALTSFFVWFFRGKDDHITPMVTFYPPEDKNSAEIGVEYSGQASSKEVISLIFYLASKGYIGIINDSKYVFIIKKIKEYDGKNPVEKKLMKALFRESDEITKWELETSEEFFQDCNSCVRMLDNIKESLFEKKPLMWLEVTIILTCIVGIISILADFQLNILSIIFFSCLFVTMAVCGLIIVFKKIKNWVVRIFMIFWSSAFAGSYLFVLHLLTYDISFTMKIMAALGVFCSVICMINLPKRNKKGTKQLRKILGFKKFLEVAEKSKLERLVRQNPSYCYDILPYAYVLGVSDVWIKKFESITQEPPQWYTGSNFGVQSLKNISAITTAMDKLNAGTSSGRSYSSRGGGGHSGGGHGGGGGHSW